MSLAFTGTQYGATSLQCISITRTLYKLGKDGLDVVMHGGCIGADVQFHERCLAILPKARIEIWPSNILDKHGVWTLPKGTNAIVHEELDPLERNRRMVNRADILLATPKQLHPVQRSGTWATIRYAQGLGKRVLVCQLGGAILEWTPESQAKAEAHG